MAKVDPNWTIRHYPAELKAKLDEMLKETEKTRAALDNLDKTIVSTNTGEGFKTIARAAVGHGNYLRKKLGKLAAVLKNTKSTRYLEIKFECAQKGLDFVSTVAMEEASAYANDLRIARDILDAYVVSADNLISVCRLNLLEQEQFSSTASIEVEG
jgi:hypothetical protein